MKHCVNISQPCDVNTICCDNGYCYENTVCVKDYNQNNYIPIWFIIVIFSFVIIVFIILRKKSQDQLPLTMPVYGSTTTTNC